MADRLSVLDASLLDVEEPATPMHVGGVAIFDRPPGFGFPEMLAHVGNRLDFLPRYRQRVVPVPGNLARPVWADDVDFDLNYHVRRSALPTPGTDGQLFDLVARLMARPLARERPLWEAYFVEGLVGDKVALVTKSHQSMVDGFGTLDLLQLLLEPEPYDSEPDGDQWAARRTPSAPELVLDAAGEVLARPGELVHGARAAAREITSTAGRALGGVTTVLRGLGRPEPSGLLNRPVSGGRVFAGVRTRLEDYRAVRAKHGGTVNDVVLAVLTGALREWLASRGEAPSPEETVRALVPLAVLDPETVSLSSASLVSQHVNACFADLPVGEADPVVRLQHVVHTMAEQAGTQRPVTASAMLSFRGFAPATLHSLAARAAAGLPGRNFNVLVANTPGPQQPMFAGQARLSCVFPVMPIVRDQSLAVGVTSYLGNVYIGLNGDRKALFDVDILAGLVVESLEELLFQ